MKGKIIFDIDGLLDSYSTELMQAIVNHFKPFFYSGEEVSDTFTPSFKESATVYLIYRFEYLYDKNGEDMPTIVIMQITYAS
jgi:hypothetical protein